MGGVEVDLDFGIWFDWRLLCWMGIGEAEV